MSTSSLPEHLYLGFDCSTQGLKVVALDATLQVAEQANVNFSADLPSFGTKSGVHLEPGGVVNAPVEMYIQAIDLLMERLQAAFDFSRVVSISGAGQQHACVLFNNRASQLLRSLKPAKPLASQLKDAFASPTVTNWQDSSTTRECAALESGLPGGRDELARLTGSKAHERFTGPQIRKLVTRGVDDVWAETAKIALVSNALATILCADGEIKPYDEADACGMNLYSLLERKFSPELIALTAPDQASALAGKLCDVELDPGAPRMGTIGPYFAERYGFRPDCIVAPFTGDNPSTLLSFTLSPGDAVVSLGTSDTVLLASNDYLPDPDYHVFGHPMGDAPGGKRRYMAMLCYKNGSLSRERVRDEHFGGSWESFNASFDTSSAPAAGIQGQVTVFSFDKPEILPSGVSGVHVFRDGAYLAGGEADLTAEERASLARRVVESQFMSFRKRVTGILKDGGQLRRIFVAGGGSVNPTITKLLADVMGCPVYIATGSAQGCAVGAAYRAGWAHAKSTEPATAYEDFVYSSILRADLKQESDVAGARQVAEPDTAAYDAYGAWFAEWNRLELEVEKRCLEATAKADGAHA